jgi:hypothetical protein
MDRRLLAETRGMHETDDVFIRKGEGVRISTTTFPAFVVEQGFPVREVVGKYTVRVHMIPGYSESWEMIEERSGMVLSDKLGKKTGIARGLHEHAMFAARLCQERLAAEGKTVQIRDKTGYCNGRVYVG